MRTTLKRGLGRAEENGRASYPPTPASLSPLTPVSKYGGRRRGPLRIVGKILLWALVFVLVAAGALAGGAWLFFNQSVAAVRAHSPEVRQAQKILDTPLPGKPVVALLIGYDQRAIKGWTSRSDTIMLVRADPGRKTISLLSFPRDLVVTIPGCSGHPSWRDRINAAYAYCGPKGTLKTVKSVTGLPINYMITVNFRGFMQIVNRLGGVYLDVDRRYFHSNAGLGPGETYAQINLHPGYQRLNGSQALSFVRYRHTDSDLYRVVRQQEFVKAVKQQISSLWDIQKVPGIVNVITHNVEVAKGGSHELSPDDVIRYAKLAYALPAGNFQQIQIQEITGGNELSAPESAIEQAVTQFTNPDTNAAQTAANVATGRKPKRLRAPDPRRVTVEVLNGNGTAGSADDAAYLLSQRGYKTDNGGNADRFDYFHTTIFYDPSGPRAKRAADAMARLFADAVVQPAGTSSRQTTMLRVVVGQTFHGTLSPPPPEEPAPKHQPPAVTRDTSVLPVVRQARRKAGFPLLAPVVKERSSVLDAEEELRVYHVAGHKALRIVYRTATDEYWGVEETTWTDAPVLAEPTLTRKIGRRTYQLYFNRSHLHTVAFEQNGVSYWVVNTLLDRLSNETMLAIAKGLRPVSGH